MKKFRLLLLSAILAVVTAGGAYADVKGTGLDSNGEWPGDKGHKCSSDRYGVEISGTYGTASVVIQYVKPGTDDTFINVPDTPTWTTTDGDTGTVVTWPYRLVITLATVDGSTDLDVSINCISS